MTYIVVGHRGAGKSTFIRRAKAEFEALSQTCHAFELESEIERREGRSLDEIAEHDGSGALQEIKERTLHRLVEENFELVGTKFVAVGADYAGKIPVSAQVLWLRRPTDNGGRLFVDQFVEREERFRQIFDRVITIGEGWDFANPFETALLGLKPAHAGFSVTLQPYHLLKNSRLENFLTESLRLGARYIELRDDLLTEDQIFYVARLLPTNKVLISFRNTARSEQLLTFSGPYATDWDVSLGKSPLLHNSIASLHSRLTDETVDEAAERLLQVKAEHYKLAVPISDFVELWAGHRFYTENRTQRSFQPVSKSGRWAWYRQTQSRGMHLNFARNGADGEADQPLYFDFLRCPQRPRGFVAVLGQPLLANRTPAEQSGYLSELDLGMVALPMIEEECNSLNMSILERLGMRAAAVTSPLKRKAMEICRHVDRVAQELHSVNTIVNTRMGWSGTNTDAVGVRSLFTAMDWAGSIAVWGGGGTRLALRTMLPHARFFSARRGEEIWMEYPQEIDPDVVVWAVGRSRMASSQMPPAKWRPKYVLDLNYTEDSPGLEYAVQVGAKYISGRGFFKSQAVAQRRFWSAVWAPSVTREL